MASTVTKSQSFGMWWNGDPQHGCAADKSKATAGYNPANMNQNTRRIMLNVCLQTLYPTGTVNM